MKSLLSPIIILAIIHFSSGGPLRLQKRAAFYIANETACVVDDTVYTNGDPIPTDDPCEACKCRPPGFACVLKDCEVKPGCRAVRRTGHCCPDYICGCEHNGRMFRDGDEIRDSQNPCYTCHCQGSSIACAFVDCFFRVDCPPEYVPGECCPRYTNCNETANLPYEGKNPYLKDKESSIETTAIVPGVTYVSETTQTPIIDTTIIEIFGIDTKKPDLLQLDPEVVSIHTIKAEESSDTEKETEKQDTSPQTTKINEVQSTTPQASAEIKLSPESPDVESSPDTDAKFNHDDIKSDVEIVAEQTSVSPDVSPSSIPDSDATSEASPKIDTEHSTDVSPHSEDIHSPLVVENVNVEPEEPSNTLESGNSASDYGKSLRFPEQDESSNVTESEVNQDIKTEQPQEALVSISTESSSELSVPAKIQVFTETSSTEVPVTEKQTAEYAANTDSTDQKLYYSSEENLQVISNETVTTIDEKIQSPTSNKTEADLPVDSTEENLFKSLSEKLEAAKEEILTESPKSSSTSIESSKEEVTTAEVKQTTYLLSTLKPDDTTDKLVKKDENIEDSITSTANSSTDVAVPSTDIH